MKHFIRLRNGFTLIEMLVVIGIISILIGISAVSYSTVQKQTRNTRRKADLRTIQNGLEQYRSCSTGYPKDQATLYAGLSCNGTTILNPVPTDPLSGVQYTYTSDGTTYTICTSSLEGSSSGTGVPYCLSNLQ